MKQDKKAAREALKEAGMQQQPPSSVGSLSSQVPNPSTQHSNVQSSISNKKKTAVKKTSVPRIDGSQMFDNNAKFKTTVQPVQPEVVELSSDDEESDDEIHHFMVSIVIFEDFYIFYIPKSTTQPNVWDVLKYNTIFVG